jgi:hypothetical protein
MKRDAEEDEKALVAGARIRAGDFSRGNLLAVFRWKTKGHGASRLERNTDEEIADALKLAQDAKTERAAVSVLGGLTGVEVPVASAIAADTHLAATGPWSLSFFPGLGINTRRSALVRLWAP